MKSKGGISTLIATVLLIGFTIVLAALVITWGTGLFKKTVGTTERESQFNILCTTGIDYDVFAEKIGPFDGRTAYAADISNKKNQKIYGFYFTAKNPGGNTEGFTTNALLVDGKYVEMTTSGSFVNPITGKNPGEEGYGKESFAELDSFEIKTYYLRRGERDDYTLLEARPIVQLDSGEKRVCEQSTTFVIAS